MEIKELFKMAKTDRYTADGREAIIKVQEAETEDVRYEIGQISQKTGLQKTANGWVKPKSGKQAGAKKEDTAPLIKKLQAKADEYTEMEPTPHNLAKFQNIMNEIESLKEQAEAKPAIKELTPEQKNSHPSEGSVKKHEGNAESKPAAMKPDGVDKEGNIKIPKAGMNVLVKVNGNRPGKIVSSRGDYVEVEMPARGAYPGRRDTYYKSDLKFDEEMKADALERSEEEEKAEQQKREAYKTKEIEKVKKLEGLDIETFTAKLDKMGYEFAPRENKKGEIVGGASWGTFGMNSADKPEFEYKYSKEKGIHDVTIRDAAPRVLTGDTRIRVRKP